MTDNRAKIAKQFLLQYKELNSERDSIYDEIQRLRSLSTQTSSGNFDCMPKAAKDNAEATYARVIEKIMEKEDSANKKLLEMLALEDEINEALSAIPEPTYQKLLRYRYINLYSWVKISHKMGYSEDHVRGYLHGQALLAVKVPQSFLDKLRS